jgi:hypothetical protein
MAVAVNILHAKLFQVAQPAQVPETVVGDACPGKGKALEASQICHVLESSYGDSRACQSKARQSRQLFDLVGDGGKENSHQDEPPQECQS